MMHLKFSLLRKGGEGLRLAPHSLARDLTREVTCDDARTQEGDQQIRSAGCNPRGRYRRSGACGSMDSMSGSEGRSKLSTPKDGELALRADYKSWPTFLKAVQKPDAVRDLYINTTGARTAAGQMFPNGTVFVMEIYQAKKMADGNLEKGTDGKLVKDRLAKIFVMQKGDGWGQDVPDNMKTGNWVYSAFTPDGEPLKVNFNECRACHVPVGAQKDWAHRYDEYFETRGRM